MFGKHKKQKSKSPIEEMEQFYLNQFLNNTKTPPQGYNGMSPLGPSFNQMMGPNTSAGPQFQSRNGGMTAIGGLNPMMNNNFNPAQMPMVNNNLNMNSNHPPMMNNLHPIMNNNPNLNPMMNPPLNPNYYPMMDNNYPQPQMMNNTNNDPYSIINNNLNSNPMPIINNGGNPNSYPMTNHSLNSMNPPYSIPTNNYLQNQTSNYGVNTNPYQIANNNFNQQPSLIHENLSANIGVEPSGNESFPGQFSFNHFSYPPTQQEALPDLTPSLEDLTGTNILSNQYFRPNHDAAGSDIQQTIQDNTSKTAYNHPALTPTNVVGTSNPNIPTYSTDPAVPSPPPPTGTIMAVGQGYDNNQMPPSFNSSANYTMTNTANVDMFDIKNKVDNINIRLRKVESYLGFRPETTI